MLFKLCLLLCLISIGNNVELSSQDQVLPHLDDLKNDVEEELTAIYDYNLPSEQRFLDHQINLQQDEQGYGNQPITPWFNLHRFSNLICWGFVVDIGIIAARYGKIMKYRMDFHGAIMTLLFIPSLFAEIGMIFTQPPYEEEQQIDTPHDIIGYAFIGLMTLQVLTGICIRMGIETIVIINSLKLRSMIHVYGGHFIYLLAKAQIGLGIYIMYEQNKDWIIAFWIIYFFIFFWRFLLEILYLNGKLYEYMCLQDRSIRLDASEQLKIFNIQDKDINTDDLLKTEYQGKLWVVFNNSIVDLTGLTHPGGNFIWIACQGREVSRFLYGAYGLEESQIQPYQHSKYAFKWIELNTIGYIHEIPFYWLQNQIISQSSITEYDSKWTLKYSNRLTDTVSQFIFTNDKFQIRTQLNFHSFGRYFIIRSIESRDTPPRPYTMILCSATSNIKFRQDLEKYLQDCLSSNPDPQQVNFIEQSNEFSLIIKKYQTPNGFSQYIHEHLNEEYVIKGPYGTSFGIPEDANIVIICGGTGLFPFLDLLDYFYKMTVHQLLVEKVNQQSADKANVNKYKFRTSLKLTLLLAIQGPEDLIMGDIILNMQKHQQQLKNQFFKMHIKSNKPIPGLITVKDRFEQEFFTKVLTPIQQYNRFLICGPPIMNRNVPNELRQMGVNKAIIHLV